MIGIDILQICIYFVKKILNILKSYHQVARNPPSIGKVTPLTMEDFSLSKKSMQLTTSSTSANLPSGILASIGPAFAGSDQPTLLKDYVRK